MSTAGRKLRVGMVGGGGPNNFFGSPHRRAIIMDNSAELTAGALRLDPTESLKEAKRLFFERQYPDWISLFQEEQMRRDEHRSIDYVTVVTPNHLHYPVAKAALEAGFPVLCEKPLTLTLAEARELKRLAAENNLPTIVANTYTGFAMVMLARYIINQGQIGEVRTVDAWYPQGWLATALEITGQQQASWRVDPDKAGISGCGGDIGSHAYEFVVFLTGRPAEQVSARLTTFVPGRRLDDDFTVLAKLSGGAEATIRATQVCVGAQNDCGFRVACTRGTVEWSITDHQTLKLYTPGSPVLVYRQGAEYDYMPASIQPYLRLPSGHPEGFHEALSNLHRTMEFRLRSRNGEDVYFYDHPTFADGAAGMAFLEAAVASNTNGGAWTAVEPVG